MSITELERMSSHPSLSHSASTIASQDSPNRKQGQDIPSHADLITVHNGSSDLPLSPIEDMRREAEESRKAFGKLSLSRSMQNMKVFGGGDRKGRERAKSSARPIAMPAERPPPLPSKPIPIPAPQRPPARSNNSFSSFIRKLTGRSESPKSPVTVPPRPVASRAMTAPIQARKPQLPPIDTSHIPTSKPLSAPPRAAPKRIDPPRITDPACIPLPDSPSLSSIDDPMPISTESLASPIPENVSEPSLKRIKQSGMLSLPGFAFDEADEEEDSVQPLRNLTIITRSSPIPSNASLSPMNDFAILTPTSEISNKYDSLVLAGSSPPTRAPIGTGKLEREKSKWRRSVMNLSDNLAPLNRKATSKPPPSSYDAYETHQRRIAAHRVSCAPTIHSTASVAAEMREVKDKEQVDVMETFFLS